MLGEAGKQGPIFTVRGGRLADPSGFRVGPCWAGPLLSLEI